MPQVKYFFNLLIDPEPHLLAAQDEVNAFVAGLMKQKDVASIDIKTSLSTNTIFMPVGAQSGGVVVADPQGGQQAAMAQGTQIFLLTQVTWWAYVEVGEEVSDDATTNDERTPKLKG